MGEGKRKRPGSALGVRASGPFCVYPVGMAVRWYNLDHDIISAQDADDLLRDAESRIVAETWIGTTCIFTLFTVLDCNLLGSIPLLYETQVHGPDEFDIPLRYPTRQAAIAGHKEIVDSYTSRM